MRVLSISSGGGDVEAAMEIAALVRGSHLDVEVRNGCFSSCANYIFPSGVRKRITPGGLVAWHGSPSHLHYLDRTGEKHIETADIREHISLQSAREADFMRAMGVDPFVSWFGKIPPYNVYNLYALSVADMEAFGIQNVDAPQGYGESYLAALPKVFRDLAIFVSATPAEVNRYRPAWLPR